MYSGYSSIPIHNAYTVVYGHAVLAGLHAFCAIGVLCVVSVYYAHTAVRSCAVYPAYASVGGNDADKAIDASNGYIAVRGHALLIAQNTCLRPGVSVTTA